MQFFRFLRYGKAYTVVMLGASLFLATSSAQSAMVFNWSWASGSYTAEGSFETNVLSGTITEDDLLSHQYSVFENGSLLFQVDLIAGLLDGSTSGIVANYHDYEYLIGSSSFNQVNSEVNDPDYPVDFTLEDSNGDYFGLSYDSGDVTWDLNYGSAGEVESSLGFSSGPIISSVPLPPTILLLWPFVLGFLGAARYLRVRKA